MFGVTQLRFEWKQNYQITCCGLGDIFVLIKSWMCFKVTNMVLWFYQNSLEKKENKMDFKILYPVKNNAYWTSSFDKMAGRLKDWLNRKPRQAFVGIWLSH